MARLTWSARNTVLGISIVLAAGASLLGAACGKPAATPVPSTEVNVGLADYSITPVPASVSAGQVTFIAKNTAAQEHEVVIIKTGLAPNALKMKSSVSEVDEEASGQTIGEVDDVEAGETKRGTFQLAAGKYVLFCNLTGHYKQGMTTAFEVK